MFTKTSLDWLLRISLAFTVSFSVLFQFTGDYEIMQRNLLWAILTAIMLLYNKPTTYIISYTDPSLPPDIH